MRPRTPFLTVAAILLTLLALFPAACGIDSQLPACTAAALRGATYSWTAEPQVGLKKGPDVKWTLQADSCSLESMQASRALDCFANRTIILLGDSLLRYQYINLADFLVSGRWDAFSPPSEEKSKFRSWNYYYRRTNERLKCMELSDTYRAENADIEDETQYKFDNRVLVIPLQGGGFARVLFFFYPGSQHRSSGIHSHYDFLAPFPLNTTDGFCTVSGVKCRPGECSQPPAFTEDLLGFVSTILPRIAAQIRTPIDLVVSQGLWPDNLVRGSHCRYIREVTNAAARVLGLRGIAGEGSGPIASRRSGGGGQGSGRLFWRTTTAYQPSLVRRKPYLEPAGVHPDRAILDCFDRGFWTVDPTHDATRPLLSLSSELQRKVFIDPRHYSKQIYREINKVLLGQLCS